MSLIFVDNFCESHFCGFFVSLILVDFLLVSILWIFYESHFCDSHFCGFFVSLILVDFFSLFFVSLIFVDHFFREGLLRNKKCELSHFWSRSPPHQTKLVAKITIR